jgi:hypothetical protein
MLEASSTPRLSSLLVVRALAVVVHRIAMGRGVQLQAELNTTASLSAETWSCRPSPSH